MTRTREDLRSRVAVAMRYRHGQDVAPVVTATGRGLLADRIVELAAQAQVPIHQDADLAEALDKVGTDRSIPPELYAAVAEVIAFVHRLRPTTARATPA
ncbi:MAG: EscU/YscU/HrcU family type III secretion system export apparatus switch protein [Fibrobacteria bacterium]|nr:EscU/YscU/HrcU family type III secretion system export apparatus switch protein [Fibrobacteria bacterium]